MELGGLVGVGVGVLGAICNGFNGLMKFHIQTNKLRPTGLGIQATSALVNGRFARSAR